MGIGSGENSEFSLQVWTFKVVEPFAIFFPFGTFPMEILHEKNLDEKGNESCQAHRFVFVGFLLLEPN